MSEHNFWWMFRFKLKESKCDTPDFYLDSLLAKMVVKPIIEKVENVSLWRFHRRAANDTTGHQFSFICFTTQATAKTMDASFEQKIATLPAAVRTLLDCYFLEGPVGRSNERSATSDPRWNESLQNYWPDFIMGASKLWLGLIDEAYSAHCQTTDPLVLFQAVDGDINTLWSSEGQHALLHHLSALFGYKPLSIQREILF